MDAPKQEVQVVDFQYISFFLPFESIMYEFHLSIFNQFSIMIYFTMFNTLTIL